MRRAGSCRCRRKRRRDCQASAPKSRPWGELRRSHGPMPRSLWERLRCGPSVLPGIMPAMLHCTMRRVAAYSTGPWFCQSCSHIKNADQPCGSAGAFGASFYCSKAAWLESFRMVSCPRAMRSGRARARRDPRWCHRPCASLPPGNFVAGRPRRWISLRLRNAFPSPPWWAIRLDHEKTEAAASSGGPRCARSGISSAARP